ncbi:AcrR family transcriptional regulator [Desulfohalotomaculum tongense]|uniref:TetR/AcrR family transcriptional regulator n=1 Tax=Desulforadius tongensis TaxID=1216062 RepID=UPI0019562233|nr:TetR/AcrR family transcriptional regulator [Desulforadius tongensis]MBM7853651.1 AcrR family transcriptional regulator [Desulforadius tongensis]
MSFRERNPEESKQRIIKAAEKIFAAKGLDGARVDEIAAAAQINKRMIYHYYGSKEGLYMEILRKNYNKVIKVGQRATKLKGSALEKVTQVIRQYFYFLAENEEFVRLIQWESLHHSRYARKILPDIAQVTLPKLKAILKEGIQEGVFRSDLDIRHLVISINAVTMMYFARRDVYSFLWQQDMMHPKTLEERLQHIIDFTLHGILNHRQGEGTTYEKNS